MGSEVANAIETELLSVDSLTPYAKNPRTGDVEAIKKSLTVNGQYRAIVVRAGTHEVLAGNHTLAAAKALGWSELLCHVVDVDDEQAARIVLVDNRSNDLATYDKVALTELLRSLPDLKGSGYGDDFLDELLTELAPAERKEDTPAVELEGEPRTKRGDVYALAGHRLICGDSRDAMTVARLLDDAVIHLAFTSPPYADRRIYDEDSGFRPIPPDEYVEWFNDVQVNVAQHLADDGSWFVNIKPSVTPEGLDTELYVLDLVLAHVRQWGWHFATEYCWERNGVPKRVSRRFKNQFEPVYQFTRGDWKMRPDEVRHHSDNVPIPGGPGVGSTTWDNAQGGNAEMFGARKRSSNLVGGEGAVDQGNNRTEERVIAEGMAYPGNRLPTFSGSHKATGHTAAFPVGLPQFFINAYTDAADNIYDPFMGSGSTLIAAENTNRTAYGAEISPKYCDIIVDRWERHTGQKAELLNG